MHVFWLEPPQEKAGWCICFVSHSVHCIFIPDCSPLAVTFPESVEDPKLHILLIVVVTSLSRRMNDSSQKFISKGYSFMSDHALQQPQYTGVVSPEHTKHIAYLKIKSESSNLSLDTRMRVRLCYDICYKDMTSLMAL